MAEEFERIVREFQDKIFRLAFSMLGDRAAAEETAQDVLFRVWKGLPRFRRRILALHLGLLDHAERLPDGADPRRPAGRFFGEPAARREAERRVAAGWPTAASPDADALLDRLPAKYRHVVALFYMQEKSYDEVARMLGLPVGTVKTYLFRARKSLAEELARERVRKGAT